MMNYNYSMLCGVVLTGFHIISVEIRHQHCDRHSDTESSTSMNNDWVS